MWHGVARCGKVRQDAARCGMVWHDVAKCVKVCQVWKRESYLQSPKFTSKECRIICEAEMNYV